MNRLIVDIPEGFVVDVEKTTPEHIVFKEKEKKLPMSWGEIGKISGFFIENFSKITYANNFSNGSENHNIFPTKEYAEAALALSQLLQLRQAWIGNWKPNWEHGKFIDTIGVNEKNKLNVGISIYPRVMVFPSSTMATKFLDAFKDLLETAKPLL